MNKQAMISLQRMADEGFFRDKYFFLFFFQILLDDPFFYMVVHDLMCDKDF